MMPDSILAFLAGIALGLAFWPVLKLADHFRWKALLGKRARKWLPWLWVPLGGPIQELRWRLGYYRRNWLKCEVCGIWVNSACQPCRFGVEERNGKAVKVGWCSKCKEKLP